MAKKMVSDFAAEEEVGGWLEAWEKRVPRPVLSKHCGSKG